MVTHAAHHAARVCDQAVVMSSGRVIHAEQADASERISPEALDQAVARASEGLA
jgi:ABC-type cobalamin/Fe3+-siderophores transport system ATPase subunit